jgi:hypothetical protein
MNPKIVGLLCLHGSRNVVILDELLEGGNLDDLIYRCPGCWKCGASLINDNKLTYQGACKVGGQTDTQIVYMNDQGTQVHQTATDGVIYMTCSRACSDMVFDDIFEE